jgi:hypothetical protein
MHLQQRWLVDDDPVIGLGDDIGEWRRGDQMESRLRGEGVPGQIADISPMDAERANR